MTDLEYDVNTAESLILKYMGGIKRPNPADAGKFAVVNAEGTNLEYSEVGPGDSASWSSITGMPSAFTGLGVKRVLMSTTGQWSGVVWGLLTSEYISSVDWSSIINKPASLVTLGSPVALTVGGSNVDGTSNNVARADHKHALPEFGTQQGTIAQGNDSRFSDDRITTGVRTSAGIVLITSTPPTAGQYLVATSETTAVWQNISASFADGSVAVNKLALGNANYVLTSNGTSNIWAAMSDTIHGNRGGGSLHATVGSTAGFAPAITAVGLLVSTSGTTATWVNRIGNAYISDLAWNKLTGLPTITTTAPLTGGGTLGALSLGISAATTTTRGTLPALGTSAGYLRTDGSGGTSWVSTTAPSAHASSHITGGSDVIGGPTNAASGLVPIVNSADKVLVSNGTGTSVVWSQIYGTHIATGTIFTNRIITGAAGTLLSSDGTDNAFRTYAALGINTGNGTQHYLPKYTATGNTLGNSAVVDDGSAVYVRRDATGVADSPLDWSQFSVRSSSDPTLRLALAFDTTRGISLIQSGHSGVGELSLAINPKGGYVGIGTAAPVFPLQLTSDGDGYPAAPVSNAQFAITGRTDTTKRFAIQLDTTNNIARIQAGKSGIGSYPIAFVSNVGFGDVLDPSAAVDTASFRLRAGAGAGKILNSYANGTGYWDTLSNAGYTSFSASVTVNTSDTLATVGSVTIGVNADRANQTWVGTFEIEMYTRTTSSATALVICRVIQSISITYDASGNATIASVTSEANGNDYLTWANHNGGVPTILGFGLGAVTGNSAPIQLSKAASGSAFKAKSRYRVTSEIRTDNW